MTSTSADLYMRLSDFRTGDADTFESREAKLRAEAARLGWTVGRLVVENDVIAAEKGRADGRSRPASAFKRVTVLDRATGKPQRDPVTGRIVKRVYRPGWQSVISDLANGRAGAVLAEDLDRTARDPRDIEDLIDACAERGASARSLSGSLTLTAGGTDSEITMARVMVTMGNKSSRDTARRVADSRERRAAAGSYGGGRRPFGYAQSGDATLTIVPAEASVIRAAAAACLADVSLRAIARDWRESGIATVTGAAWTPDTVRGVLMSHAVAGLALHTATVKPNGDAPRTVVTVHPATWPAILDRDTWQAVTDKLTDPARRTNTSNEPRWLVSGTAKCHCGHPVYCRNASGRPSYVCSGPQAHLRRVAPATDSYVAAVVVERLSRDDAADLFRPAPVAGVDAPALRKERERLSLRKSALVRLNVAGDLDDTDLAAGLREIKRRLNVIESDLHQSTAPDPLAELRDQPDVAAAWAALSLPRRRAIVKLLMTITLLPGRPGAPRRFDPESVRIDWAA